MQTKTRRSLTIAFASAILIFNSACSMTTELKSAPTPEGDFCKRVEQPPPFPVGRIGSQSWALWVSHILGNYDCTCPGGKYFGQNLPECKGTY